METGKNSLNVNLCQRDTYAVQTANPAQKDPTQPPAAQQQHHTDDPRQIERSEAIDRSKKLLLHSLCYETHSIEVAFIIDHTQGASIELDLCFVSAELD